MTVNHRRGSEAVRRLLVCAGMASLLCACAALPKLSDLAPGGVDPSSPAAADVAAASRSPGAYPKFSDVPPVPNDVRPASGWKAAVLDEAALKQQTEVQAAAVPFTLGGTEAFAASQRAKIAPALAAPAPSGSAAETEAFAAAARARATPPPKAN